MITGSFTLVGIQDAIVYESCYKRTEHNVRPSTPVSEAGEIPEGWSATMLDVSASFPYLWESQRARTEMYSSNDISNAVLLYAGYRISNTGNKVSDANYKYSDNIKLYKGQVIEVNTAGSSVSVISLSNGITASFTPVKTLNSTVPQVSTYTADEDCNVVVCVKTTSAYSVKIYTASYGAWSTPTLKNSWGKQGAKLRMRTWAENVVYLQGADDEEFYDVVVYNDKLYLCTKTHTSGPDNNPSDSISGYLGYWESAQDWTFIATKLLISIKIKAEQIDATNLEANGLKAKNADIEGKIVAESGLFKGDINIGDGSNTINQDGSGHIAKGNIHWDSNGNIEFGEKVTFGGFISHIQMPFIPVRQSSGNNFYYISESTPVTNKILLSSTNNNDMVILPRGEKWSGALLYIYNISSSNSLKVNTGDTIPARGVGVFSGFSVAPNTPETTTWAKLAISGTAATLGINYEDSI